MLDNQWTHVCRPFIAALPFTAACWLIADEIRPVTFLVFFASVAAALPIYVVPCWFIVLSRAERDTLTVRLRQRVLGTRAVEGLS